MIEVCFTKWKIFFPHRESYYNLSTKKGLNVLLIYFVLPPPPRPFKAQELTCSKAQTHTELPALITLTSPYTLICKKKKKAWYSPCFGFGGLRSLSLWCAELCLSCFVPKSQRHSLAAASWSGVQEATWRYLSSNPGRFPPRHWKPPPPSSVNQSR